MRNHSGFTLLEILVATAVLAFGILAVGSMQVTSIRQNAHANRVTEASILARDQLERLMAFPYDNAALDEGESQKDDSPTGYTISWDISNEIANTKLITVTVQHDKLRRDIVLTSIKPGPP